MASLVSVQLEDGRQLLAFAAEKLRQEPTQWPGLMVSFQKIVYPTYDVTQCSDVSDNDTQIRSTHPIFSSSEAYVCYEVAYQLHRIMSVVKQCLCILPPEKQYEEPDLELKWMLVDAPPAFLAFQRLLSVWCEEKEEKEAIESEDEDVVLVVSLANKDDRASENWQMRSWEQFYRGVEAMESFDDLVLASRDCLHAYLKWMNAAYSLSAVPIYFSKCNAGYHLVRILHIAVGLYEKMRKYQIATLLLNEMLASPFLERKRGYWWDRLALNLEHMKCSTQAIDTCVNALEDPHVLAADRIAVERRLHRLRRQCARQEEHRIKSSSPVDLMLQSTGTSFLVPLVVISDNDEDNDEKTMPAEAQCTYQYRQEHIVGRPLNRQTGEKSRFVGYDDEPCTIEQLVLQYYRDYHLVNTNNKQAETGGWYGVHSEGSVLRNLFGILMWDVLYARIPDVFQTPFQSGPLDFGYADVFYEARRDLIDQRISQVQEKWTMEELLTAFLTRWNAEFGKVTRFVHWPSDEGASLKFHMLTIAAIGRMELASLLRYMATSKEYHQARNGLPDLLLLRIKLSGQATCPDLESLQRFVDSHDCLNIYAICGMDEHLNMNEKTRSSVEVLDETKPLPAEKLDVSMVQTVLQLVQHSCAASLKCVEVKGPRDRLSDKQLLWLRVLNEEVRLDASVMHVEEPEKRAKRKMKKKKKMEHMQSEANMVSRKRQSTGRR
uniref:Fanconi-associated nuclease n=1 Tax=Peronospora matthiolae TaxID=2874970 RepID=A0AAV1U944_9STRA